MKTAVITGASRRLGLFLVEKLIDQGWQVHALTRSASPELQQLSSKRLHIHEHFSYHYEQIQRCTENLLNTVNELDLLVNNASIYESDDTSQNPDFYLNLFTIHMQFPALLAEKLQGALQRAGGNIVSISDIYADNPREDYSLYCSTKAGLQNLSLSLAKKLAPEVRVNCIQPGPIKFLDEHDQAHKDQVLQQTLVAREGGFGPIFETLQFILNNHYLTGSCIKVDGGRSLVRG
ncbi:SDR family NAD(P)-dependent oxidoreductase [Agaribacterium haliotis]|uniref:SDR family NAD(P)-dependent oxidoreductase n=1 Tax=Agaribacterium haliotis TaxID=2013869 RepID=UPI000BB54ABE|nr:SDR family NAD(P)-dependent oxidoreductase [Agaribacterium haliotis]